MSTARPPSSSVPCRKIVYRWILYFCLILFMGNLGAMVDLALHPEIPYFDDEHLIAGGTTAVAMFLLLVALETYLARRRQIEGSLRASEERLLEAQSIARIGYYSLDAATGVWTSSRILDEIFGIGDDFPRDVEGWSRLLHPDDRKAMLDYLRKDVLEKVAPFDRQYRIVRHSDQVVRWVHGVGRVEADPDNRAVRMVGTIQDVTEKVGAEEEKDRLQAQLQQAMKMEAIGRLAGGVAHDFNNLLTVIIGNVALAQSKVPPSEPVAGMLTEVHRAAERAARLTQQLLAFSRKQIIEPQVLDLNALVVDLHKMLVRLIGENIRLATVPGEGLGAVKVDPGQFEQILVNLAVNARDAMPAGGRLTIETANVELDVAYCATHPESAPGRYVLLAVSDTGHGMTEEVRARIFEPFFTTKEKGGGTGLGLSMAHGAVKQAGGSISVYSEVGKGTTVRIYLPRVEGVGSAPAKPAAPQEIPVGTETVLLVEDEDVVRNLCVRILERQGYKVLMAGNGAEAIALARAGGGRIDLLLTDVMMPGMNGNELATQLVLLYPEMKVLFTRLHGERDRAPRGAR